MNTRHATILSKTCLITALAAFALPAVAGENATFDKTFTVTAPVRIELSNGSGNVEIRGSADGSVHVHGKVSPGDGRCLEAERKAWKKWPQIHRWSRAEAQFASGRILRG